MLGVKSGQDIRPDKGAEGEVVKPVWGENVCHVRGGGGLLDN